MSIFERNNEEFDLEMQPYREIRIKIIVFFAVIIFNFRSTLWTGQDVPFPKKIQATPLIILSLNGC